METGQYVIDNKTEVAKGKKRVYIVKGGWSCAAGYIIWAYVAEINDIQFQDYTAEFWSKMSEYEKAVARIGKRLCQPPNIQVGKEGRDPYQACQQWCSQQGYAVEKIVVMRTD